MTIKHKGLRLSLLGGVVFLASVALLLTLPDAIGAAGMLAGGFMVWGGLIWTIFGYYGSPGEPPPPPG